MERLDLFLIGAEPSADLHGKTLIDKLLEIRPDLKIGAVAGPLMRQGNIKPYFQMETLCVMGFTDVLFSLPKLIRQFFAIRNKILALKPRAVVFIDYPGFNLRLANSLRKKGYSGQLIHFICPTVWAWGKKRIPLMERRLDLLLTLFPFEKQCFAHTHLPVEYVGHPLALPIEQYAYKAKFQGKIIALFPGSRKTEIERNLPLQLKAARRLKTMDPTLQIAISLTHFPIEAPDVLLVAFEDRYELMRACHLAIATSGTVTLELALHQTPTIVTFAIRPLDCFIAQKILRIHLPFYCIANIIINKQVFPELFGPHFNEKNLFFWTEKLWFDRELQAQCKASCLEVKKTLGVRDAAKEAAQQVLRKLSENCPLSF